MLFLTHVRVWCYVMQDGQISYEEFVPLCFDILVERFKFDMLQNKALNSGDGLTQCVIQDFQARPALLPFQVTLDILTALLVRSCVSPNRHHFPAPRDRWVFPPRLRRAAST